MRYFLSFILFSLLVLSGFSQEFYNRNYELDSGLPTNEIYHVFQDSRDLIWFSTDKGVAVFDGYEFKNFDSSDGLIDNTVFEVFEDLKGRIWVVTFSNNLYYISNDTILPYKYNHTIQDVTLRGGSYYSKNGFYIDENETLYLSFYNLGLLAIDSLGTVNLDQYNRSRGDFNIIDYGFDKIFYGKEHKFTPNRKGMLIKNKLDSINNLYVPLEFGVFNRNILKSKYSQNYYIISGNELVIVGKQKCEFYKLPESIISVSEISKDFISLGTSLHGVYLFSVKDGKVKETLLEGKSVSYMIQDHEGGFWVTTLNEGVFYYPTFDIENYELNGRNIECLKKIDNKVIVGQTGGYLIETDGESFERKYFSNQSIEVLNVIEKTNNYYLFGTNFNVHVSSDLKKFTEFRSINGVHYNKSTTDIEVSKEGNEYFIGLSTGMYHVKNEKLIYYTYSDSIYFRTNCLYLNSEGTLEIGTLKGLLEYKNGKLKNIAAENPVFNVRIEDIVEYKNVKIYATKGLGLILKKGNEAFYYNENNGLLSNFISKLFLEEGFVWVGTNKGIQKLEIDLEDIDLIPRIEIQKRNGLISNEVTDIAKLNSDLYVSTKKGLSIVKLSTYHQNFFKPKLYFTYIEKGGNKIKPNSKITVYPNEKSFSIHFTGINYRGNSNLLYRYRLNEKESKWIYSKNRNIEFSLLPKGEYIFTVQVQNEDGVWSDVKSLKINVLPEFWETWWFITIVILLIGSLTAFIIRRRILVSRAINKEKLNVLELKQYSLRQQMNPHFIFNTLNSIQLYILEKDTLASHKYLSMFAKLMRLTLDNSRHSSIYLKDEITSLKIYLELEKLRYEDKMDYEINIEDDDILYNRIPTLIIQPFVEKSIWHGVMHKQSKGMVSISLSEKDENIICIVQDDGVGRANKEERKIENKPHKSLGSQILKERIELLNSVYKDKFIVNYIDLKGDDEEPKGTKVELIIPILN